MPSFLSLTAPSLIPTTSSYPTQTKINNNNNKSHCTIVITNPTRRRQKQNLVKLSITCCSSNSINPTSQSPTISSYETSSSSNTPSLNPPVLKKRKRYRKLYPGEINGITEEMRFVAMRLRNVNGKHTHKSLDVAGVEENQEEEENVGGDDDGESWVPSIEGFVKYLVDSRLVFSTIERVVDKSEDVSYAYFRRTRLERSEAISKDLEWLSQREDVMIPEPSNPGISYSKYLEELAENSAPLFLSHFYNIYFSHIAGGQVLARQVSEKLLEGRELEFYRWDGDAQQLLKNVRDKLNTLGEHWTRDEKNKCLKEATKSFRYMGQIVRLIIL